MKTAIYIEDGVVQLVITPESEFEKNAISSFEERELDAKIFTGSFYDCRGGWVRQSDHYTPMHGIRDKSDKSIIIKIKEEEKTT